MSKFSDIVHRSIRLSGLSGVPVWMSKYTDLAIPFIPLNHHFRADDLVFVERDHARFAVNRSDYMQWHLWSNLVEDNWKHCAERYREGSAIIDVGANIGAFSLKIASLLKDRMGETGRVIAVEPNPNIVKTLRSQIEANPEIASRIDVWDVAMGDYDGTIHFQVDQSNTGGGRVTSDRTDHAISVPVGRLDDLVVKRNVTNVGILKIDVEGFEQEVLRGASAVIERDRPVLYLEVTDVWLKSRGHSAYGMLRQLADEYGYRFLRDQGRELQPLTVTQAEIQAIFDHEIQINVIGLPPEVTMPDNGES